MDHWRIIYDEDLVAIQYDCTIPHNQYSIMIKRSNLTKFSEIITEILKKDPSAQWGYESYEGRNKHKEHGDWIPRYRDNRIIYVTLKELAMEIKLKYT